MNLFERSDRAISILALLIVATTFFYSLLSGPVAELIGLKNLLPGVSQLKREARIILVYHTLAVPFISLITIFLLSTLYVKEGQRRAIVHALTFGSFATSLGGVFFGYLGGGMIAHGIFILGLSVVFYAGLNFFIALLKHPVETAKFPYFSKEEKIALLILTAAILISAVLGASVGAFFGKGFSAVLAEDIIRSKHNIFERAVISHLHIMLALIAAAVLAALTRFFMPEKGMGKAYFYLFSAGTVITSLATWAVLIFEKTAHKVINVGAVILIAASMIFVFKAVKEELRLKSKSVNRLLSSFLLVFVNFIVTIPGVYVALNLEHFRTPQMAAVERTFAVGHWHVLGVICALIMADLYFEFVGLKSRLANFSIALMNIFTSLALLFAVVYMFSKEKVWMTAIDIFLPPGFILLILVFIFAIYKGIFKAFRGYSGQHFRSEV